MMQDALIYKCRNGCTIAIPATEADFEQTLEVSIADLGFPECSECTRVGGTQHAKLSVLDDGSVKIFKNRETCIFELMQASHRSFVPHKCNCGKPTSEPEPPIEEREAELATPAENGPAERGGEQEIQNVGFRKWEIEEDEVIITCTSPIQAINRFRDVFPGRRNENAVKQRYYTLKREGKLIAVGTHVRIVSGGVFSGQTGKIASFTDAKTSANVKLANGITVQTGLFEVEVVRDD